MKKWSFIIDFFLIAALCVTIFRAAYPALDVGRYECYATAFWHGIAAVDKPNMPQCGFIKADTKEPIPDKPLYVLPFEYPILSLIPFSLGLTSDGLGYEDTFTVWMAFFAAVTYIVLRRFASRTAAVLFGIYIVLGNWETAGGRFDLVPALLTLIALICAEKKRWHWAFAILGLGVMMKIYPVVLLPLFFIAHQLHVKQPITSFHRYTPVFTFFIVCAWIALMSVVLNKTGTVAPLNYFQDRPFQLETLWSSLLWILQPMSSPIQVEFRFGSYNILSPLAAGLAPWSTFTSVIGFLGICWLLLRKKITLAIACVLMLMMITVTGKVFSPQYLIWITPFIAYAGRHNLWWVIPWLTICALTTWIITGIYPSLVYSGISKEFFFALNLRNGIFLLFFLGLIFYYAFPKRFAKFKKHT